MKHKVLLGPAGRRMPEPIGVGWGRWGWPGEAITGQLWPPSFGRGSREEVPLTQVGV